MPNGSSSNAPVQYLLDEDFGCTKTVYTGCVNAGRGLLLGMLLLTHSLLLFLFFFLFSFTNFIASPPTSLHFNDFYFYFIDIFFLFLIQKLGNFFFYKF